MSSLVSRIYSGFRGVDFRGDEINLLRSPNALNVWRDYKKTESICTRPGLEALPISSEIDGSQINGIFFYKDKMLVHYGTKLAVVHGETVLELYSEMADRKSAGFVFGDIFYIKDGKNYLQYNGISLAAVEGFVPTTSVSRSPKGGGQKHEDVNLLSDYRINSFLANGEAVDFYLDTAEIDSDFLPEIKVNGQQASGFSVDCQKGRITFAQPPEPPLTDGQDNVFIKFKKSVSGHREIIENCRLLQLFDNRVFFSGNPNYPNRIWHCGLDNPTYCSDLDYYQEGADLAAVRGLVAGNNALWVFREPSDLNTTVFYHTPTVDEDYGKIYPSVHSSISTGCIGSAINFNDDIVFFSPRGMEGISGSITTEQVLSHRSSTVDRKLLAEAGYKNMVLAEWQGYLLVFIGNKVYLADSRAALKNENHSEYEWFYWELEKSVSSAAVNNGILYLGTDSGVFTLTDFSKNIYSYWVTPKDKFGYPHRLKTTNKHGFVAEALGDITVYAKLEDTDFEKVAEFENVCDYFAAKIKCKRFKDIQLKFESNTRFSLESVTMECFVGGYVKG